MLVVLALEAGLIAAYLVIGVAMDAARLRPELSASLFVNVPALVLMLAVILRGRSTARWGLSRPRRDGLLPTLPLVAIVVLFWISSGGFTAEPVPRWLYFVVLAIAVALSEELLFRGFMLRLLLPFGVSRAVWFSSVLFAVSHGLNLFAGENPLDTAQQIVFALLFGAALGWLSMLTGSIWPGVVLHACTDFPQFVARDQSGALVNSAVIALLVIAVITLSRATRARMQEQESGRSTLTR